MSLVFGAKGFFKGSIRASDGLLCFFLRFTVVFGVFLKVVVLFGDLKRVVKCPEGALDGGPS